jgi:hypothetical protein
MEISSLHTNDTNVLISYFTICVLGSQHALISGQRLAPAGVSLVVAGAVNCSEGSR